MAAPRLPFLWPMLFRATEAAAPVSRSAIRRRAIHSTRQRCQNEQYPQRYGPANQPLPHLEGSKNLPPPTAQQDEQAKALPKIGGRLQEKGEHEVQEEHVERIASDAKADAEKKEPATTDLPTSNTTGDLKFDAAGPLPKEESSTRLNMPPDKPMESLLESVPDPNQQQKESDSPETRQIDEASAEISPDDHAPSIQAPHIEPPRYVHHFDTFGLVKRLLDGGWSETQAITIMKSMRLLLRDNLTIAQEALVSKSNVENETYLFRAACSELRTEVTTRRKAEQEKMRTERTQIQHEVDILGQRLGQESGVMKDELKGMFDDRKMAVRNEQRSMESKIQELNYKITVHLQADSKSDVEGLRWIMTRRVILTLGLIVVMVVSSLKLYSNAAHEREVEEKRRASMRSSGSQTEEDLFGRGGGGEGDRRKDGGLGGGEMLVREGDNPAFVSLG